MANIPPKRRAPKDLSGLWSGYYAYDLTDDAVAFTAWLKEENGRIMGSILEEDLSSEFHEAEYEAHVSGFRHGLDVQFTKIALDTASGEPLLLRYHGDTDAECCFISGVWFFDDPADWTGTFMMTRISGDLQARVGIGAAHDTGDDGGDEG